MRRAFGHPYFILIVTIIIGLFPRLHLLLATDAVIDSDEAIIGLMAKHINEGRSWPIFYYGQSYMGSLEAICAAFSFQIFGQSSFTLKLVPLVFSLIHIILIFELTKILWNKQAGLIAALLTALAPSGLILWSTMARGGFIELVTLGTFCLLLSVKLLYHERGKHKWLGFFMLGFCLGLGWWLNNQIIFYGAAIVPVFTWYFVRLYGLYQSFVLALAASLGFFLGGVPFWYANLFHSPRFASFYTLLAPQSDTAFSERLLGFFTSAVPIILGTRRFWSDSDLVPFSTSIVANVNLFLVLFFIWLLLRQKDLRKKAALGMILLFLLVVPIIFIASSFGWLVKAPRYLLPLYSALPVIAAVSLTAIWQNGLYLRKFISGVLFAILLVNNYLSNYYGGLTIPGQPFIHKGNRVAVDHSALYSWLRKEGYKHIVTNYWIGYRTAFETNEEVTFTRFGDPRSLRIPYYEIEAKEKKLPLVYVLAPSEAALVRRSFDRFGYSYRYQEVNSYGVIDLITPVVNRGTQISLANSQLSSEFRTEWLPNMIDGDIKTRWGSGQPQIPGMEVRIDFTEESVISGLDLELGEFIQDIPQQLLIVGQRQDGTQVMLFDSQGTLYDPQENLSADLPANLQLFFKPIALTRLYLRQMGSTTVFDWSIAELRLYGAE